MEHGIEGCDTWQTVKCATGCSEDTARTRHQGPGEGNWVDDDEASDESDGEGGGGDAGGDMEDGNAGRGPKREAELVAGGLAGVVRTLSRVRVRSGGTCFVVHSRHACDR